MSGAYSCGQCGVLFGTEADCYEHLRRHAMPIDVSKQRERRERIATAAITVLMQSNYMACDEKYIPARAVKWADALIAELDKE